jgi:predicted HicB family RNase H-like nuclease
VKGSTISQQKETRPKPFLLRLKEPEHRALKVVAAERGTSMHDQVVAWIREQIVPAYAARTNPEPRRQARTGP